MTWYCRAGDNCAGPFLSREAADWRLVGIMESLSLEEVLALQSGDVEVWSLSDTGIECAVCSCEIENFGVASFWESPEKTTLVAHDECLRPFDEAYAVVVRKDSAS